MIIGQGENTLNTNNRPLLIVLGALLLITLIGPWLLGGIMGPGVIWGFGLYSIPLRTGGLTWGLVMVFGWLIMLAFWSALIIGAVLLTRWLGGMGTFSGGAGRELAILVLRRRYAAGEITQEEYEQMRQELEH